MALHSGITPDRLGGPDRMPGIDPTQVGHLQGPTHYTVSLTLHSPSSRLTGLDWSLLSLKKLGVLGKEKSPVSQTSIFALFAVDDHWDINL